MRIEKNSNSSFQGFKPDNWGKKFLNTFETTMKQAETPAVTKMLDDFKSDMTCFANSLDKNKQTEGIDVVLGAGSTAETGFKTVPVIFLSYGRFSTRLSKPLFLNDFLDSKERPIQSRAENLSKSVKEWFEESCRNLMP